MKKRLIATLLTAALSIGLFSACGGAATTTAEATTAAPAAGATTAAAASTDTIKIGGLAPLTGPVSVYGIAVNNGITLAFEEINAKGGINGRTIDYVVMDEKGDTTEATNAYDKLVQDGIVALIGDVTSTPSIAVAQRSVNDNMPMITASGTSLKITEAGKNVFRTCFTDPYQGDIMGRFAAENLQLKKVAVLYDAGNDYCVGLADAFVARAEELGVEIVAKETYASTDVDFKAQLTKIQQAAPEALYIPDYYEKDIQITRQARAAGIDVPLLGGDGWDGVLMESVIGSVGSTDADNTYFTNHYSDKDTDERIQNFITAYKAKFNMDPVSFAALGYDSAYLLAEAIEKAGSTDKQAIIDAMTAINFAGITGNITFDENRNPVKSVTIIKIENGEYNLFDKMQPAQ